ncbi:hypothetical protein KP004_01320 [Geomonas oryzisoli]|uniref:Replication initiation protein n=1 Tax=Geomonas oryzisoli TaxID=2847992 RepID=A0ABX8J601_9BACT|nr:hypothetical protein [Geomonas oryzisoli]QWV93863.1 hypothetical protein KP004_01320 [Geomonas oryzisoli]
MNEVGLHQLRFYPREAPLLDIHGMVHESSIKSIAKQLFNLELSQFTHLKNRTSHKRKYRDAWSFNEQIIIFANDFTKRKNISIEINGSAFDHACINVEKVCKIIAEEYVVGALHAKIDTLETSFKTLYRCYQHEAVTAKTMKGSDRSSKTKTLVFGADPKKYEIYEAGLYHPHISNPNLCRHELKLEREYARMFFDEWRKAPEELEHLIKSYIAGQFGVKFKKLSSDSNVGRRLTLPMWDSWLSSSKPKRFDRVAPRKPQVANQRVALEARMLKTRLEIGEAEWERALANADLAFHLDRHPDEKSTERQLAFDFAEGGIPDTVQDLEVEDELQF